MATVEGPVVVCTYPTREHAVEFVAVLRKEGIATVAVPSTHRVGEWDVMAPGHEADRVKQIVDAMLAL